MSTPTLIYDGDCGFCTQSAKWVEARVDSRAVVRPWQAMRDELPAVGLSESDVSRAAFWVDERGRTYRGHRAIAKSLVASGHCVLGQALLVPPGSWLARPAYWLIARYRGHLPGATDSCKI